MHIGIPLSFATAFLIGHYLQRTVAPCRSNAWPEQLFRASLVVPLGLGASSWLYFVQSLAIAPSIGTVITVDLLAVTSLAAAATIRGRRLVGTYSTLRPSSVKNAYLFGLSLSLAVIAISALSFTLKYSTTHPYGGYDAWYQWNLKARVLFAGGSESWQQLLNAPTPHPGYPLLLPCSVARVWTYAGTDTPVAGITLALVMTFGTVLILFAALYMLRGAKTAMIGSSILLLTTPFLRWGASQYADVPLALFALGSASLLWIIKKTDGRMRLRYIALAGLLVSFSASTKDEGLLFLLGFVVVFAITMRQSTLTTIFIYLAVLMATACPWLLLTCTHKVLAKGPAAIFKERPTSEIYKSVLQRDRYVLTAQYAANTVLPLKLGRGRSLLLRLASHPTVLLLIAGFSFGLRRDWEACSAPLLLALFMAFGYFAAYIITPMDLDWHLRTSCDRLWLQIYPVVIYGFCCKIKPEPGWTADLQN